MKKKRLCFAIFAMLLFSACSMPQMFGTSKISDFIESPPSQNISVTGTWKQTKSMYLGEGDPPVTEEDGEIDHYIAMDMTFAGAFNQYTQQPSYRSRIVNARSYAVQKLRKEPEDVGFMEDEIEVIIVEGKDRFYLEFIVLDPTHIMAAKDGFLYSFSRESEEVTEEMVHRFLTENASDNDLSETTQSRNNGTLLLGIKSLKNANSVVPEYTYKTILLYFPKTEDEVEIMATPDLFIPRKDGFWTMRVIRSETDGVISDRIETSPFVSGIGESKESGIIMEDPIGRNITYVNDTYISMESIFYQDRLYTQYNTYTFDTIADKLPLDIALIAGEKGRNELLEKGATEAELLRNNNTSLIVRVPETDEWGIIRRNGRWIFRSVARAIEDDTMRRRGYDLHILPNTQVFSHNELAISWKTIKERHPSAIDAVSAPNSDYILIQDAFRLHVYGITNGVMEENPIAIIKNPMNDRIVMAEWALGSAANDWVQTFKNASQLEVIQ